MSRTTQHPAAPISAALEVYLLGRVDFDAALALQRWAVDEISERRDRQGMLLLCEHPPVLTVGREGRRDDILVPQAELTSRLVDVRWLNRGGGCLLHAPGQLAVYPVLPLDRLGLDLTAYRGALEAAVLDVCGELHIEAERRESQPGVFCRGGQAAFIGGAVKSWTSYHGLFLNVSPNLQFQRLAQTESGEPIASLAVAAMRRIPMHVVREAMVRRLIARLGYARHHIYTGHPALNRTRRHIAANVRDVEEPASRT